MRLKAINTDQSEQHNSQQNNEHMYSMYLYVSGVSNIIKFGKSAVNSQRPPKIF